MSATTAAEPRTAPTFELLARDLAAIGVDKVFGLFGEDTAGFVTALRAAGIEYHASRHENAGVMMASGYAESSGKLGVCVTSRGPGLTNGLTAKVTVSRGDAPVLIITGADPLQSGPGVNYKYLDGVQVLTHSGVTTYHPRSADQARQALREAVRNALRGTAVGLALPLDVLNGKATVTDDEPFSAPGRRRVEPSAESISLATRVLDESRRPLIVAGRGAYRAGARDALIELADRTGALVATSLGATGLFTGHEFNLGVVGGFATTPAKELAAQADCVVVFGASLNQFTSGFGEFFKGATLIQVDDRGEQIGRYLRADVGVNGDALLVAQKLTEGVAARDADGAPLRTAENRARLADYDLAEEFVAVPDGVLDPQEVMRYLDGVVPADRTVVPDGGSHFCFVCPFMPVDGPGRFHPPIAFHSIGLGLGTAVGAALARPNATTVLFVGDGALLMSLGELETVARAGGRMLVVVINDRSYGAEQHFVELMGLPNETTLIPNVDFAAVGRGLGLEAETVNSMDELRGLEDRIKNLSGPLLLDCKVANVRPRLYDELLGGE
jgi:thiamine pyrophosphate-dependent acetolactate synthase large subunit-like protein